MSYNSININKSAINEIDSAINSYYEAKQKILSGNDNPAADRIANLITQDIGNLNSIKSDIEALNRKIRTEMRALENRRAQAANNGNKD